MDSFKRNDNGFTGLEAAIVLIAFVVVAAVFSYVVLGAGFFTTQKAQETVHTGVQQTTSAVEPSGPVSVQADGTGAEISAITFYLQLAAGGSGVDMGKVTYTVSTTDQIKTFTAAQVTYDWVKSNGGTDQTSTAGVLNAREMVLVTIDPAFGANMGVNDHFIVEVKPPVGAALPIARTIPAALAANTWYEVY
jgi:flagellin FlaB